MIVLKKLYRKNKRPISLFVLVCLAFSVCMIKMIYIQAEISASVSVEQSKRSVLLGETRGYIYDRNMIPLVNTEKTDKTIIISNSNTKSLINNLLSDKKSDDKITDGIFITVTDTKDITEDDYTKNFYTVTRYSDNYLLRHIIGYTDIDGKGVCGIEKAFDKILNDGGGKLTAQFSTNSRGEALSLQGIEITNSNFDSPAGVSLTIDKSFQEITEKVLYESEIKTGAIVIMNSKTFEILSCVSVPCYDINNLEKSIDCEDKPFLNRALNAYPVGSVIKPFIAAASIENGFSIFDIYECNGVEDISSNEFRCFNSNSHGKIDFNSAIEKSCNCYFIDMGLKVGKEKIITVLSKFGFGERYVFCSSLSSVSGNLPECKNIKSDAQLANLCFGQGDLLVTPVQLAAAYSVIANGGIYTEPVLMKNLINNAGEVYGYYKPENSYRIISEDTADKLKTALYNNMLNGTGKNGMTTFVTSAGKTATAQTGRFDDNGDEFLCTWFAGFFPYESPEYTVVIFNENGSTAALDCAPVFKKITEEIIKLSPEQ